MTAERLIVAAIAVAVAGALITPLASRCKTTAGWIAFLVTLVSAGLALSAVAVVLIEGPSEHPKAFWAMPRLGFDLRLHVDGLSAIFVALTALISVPAAMHSVRYMHHYADYGVAHYYPFVLLFLAAMYGLVSTTDMMWFFFIFWQLMTIPGYLLIRYEYRSKASAPAGMRYLVMMQIACVATMIGAEMLAVAGSRVGDAPGLKYDFATVSANLPLVLAQKPALAATAFGLFLVGFGIKMGMWPFGHVWLPDAHPAAPSPVSAMLSGVMIKTGVYGLLRYFVWLVPEGALPDYPMASWGAIVALIGTVTLLTGTYQALRQEQSKRLLAFHSIGQVGYILLGAGACMALLASDGPGAREAATLAFLGATLHVLNHGVFKALLFLNAGSMLHATGTQDLNRLGGMWTYMPLTALTALVASCSIAGVPLFSGFVSKWTIYAAAIQGNPHAPYLAVCGAIAVLTSALTLASFVKFFGVSFLSRASAWVAQRARERRAQRPTGSSSDLAGSLEAPVSMLVPQWFLAVLCVGVGVAPAAGLSFVTRALAVSHDGLGAILGRASGVQASATLGVATASGQAAFVPAVIAGAMGLIMALVWGVSRMGASRRRADSPWLCGYADEADSNRYSAHGFYGEVKGLFTAGRRPEAARKGDADGPT